LAGLQKSLAEATAELEQQRREVTGHQEKEQSLEGELRSLRAQAAEAAATHEREGKILREQAAAAAKQRDGALREAEETRAQLRLVSEARATGRRELLEAQREAQESREGREAERRQ
ncbi:CROCC protein, partial [Baryphthengus martii]|nr:CROCC protein [Baryphthengus martii]